MVSIVLQLLIASVVIALPLLHPESLPGRILKSQLLPPPPRPQPQLPRVVEHVHADSSNANVPAFGHALAAPRIIANSISLSTPVEPAPGVFKEMTSGMPTGLPSLAAADQGNRVTVSALSNAKPGPVRVSSGVSAGLLLAPMKPVYPQIAKAARVQGSVMVEAVISKAGTIESLHVMSGPAMLQSAAIEAIRAARYQPFRLNGEPTEVQTTITINFQLGP